MGANSKPLCFESAAIFVVDAGDVGGVLGEADFARTSTESTPLFPFAAVDFATLLSLVSTAAGELELHPIAQLFLLMSE